MAPAADTLTPERTAADLAQAEQKRAELVDKLMAGTTSAKPDDLVKAEGALRAAELAHQGAVERAEAAAEVARVTRIGELLTELRSGPSGTFHGIASDLLTAVDQLEADLAKVYDLTQAYNARYREVRKELSTLGDLGEHVVLPRHNSFRPDIITVHGTEYGSVAAGQLIGDALDRLDAHARKTAPRTLNSVQRTGIQIARNMKGARIAALRLRHGIDNEVTR